MMIVVYVFAGVGGLCLLGALVLAVVKLGRGGKPGGKGTSGADAREGAVDFDAEYGRLAAGAKQGLVEPQYRREAERQQQRFDAALKKLRGDERGRRALFEAPFYLLIGPSAAGKTQLLTSSGMFRAEDRTLGTGPTLSCVWWMSSRALAIDTAGRWSTQTPELFLSFLKLLRSVRPARPLNGIVVVVPAHALVSGNRAAVRQVAEQMRARVEEVGAALEFQVPVYLVISQCDRLAGFEELFHPLRVNESERDEMFGFTLPADLGRHGDPRAIEVECARRLERFVVALEAYSVKRLREEWPRAEADPVGDADVKNATALAGFLPRFRVVANGVRELVRTLAGGDIRPPILRGVFFTSATQTEGNAVDELYEAIARNASRPGAEGDRVEEHEKATALPFFVRKLFDALLEGDAGLAYESPEAEAARARRRRRVGYVLAGAAGVAAVAAVLVNLRARRQLDDLELVASAVRRAGDGRFVPKTFDHLAEIGDVTRALRAGAPPWVAPEARAALVSTLRASIVAPILSAVRDRPGLLSHPCEHLKSLVRIGADAPRAEDVSKWSHLGEDMARTWSGSLSGDPRAVPFVTNVFELFASAASENPDLWGPPYASDAIENCCRDLRAVSASGDFWQELAAAFPGDLEVPDKLTADKPLPRLYTKEARAHFFSALKRQAGAAANADPVCPAADASATDQKAAYDAKYTQHWQEFLGSLRWNAASAVTRVDLALTLGALGEWRKHVEDVTGSDRAEAAVVGKVQALVGSAVEVPRGGGDPTLLGFLELLTLQSALDTDFATFETDVDAAAKTSPPDDKALQKLDVDQANAARRVKHYPKLVNELFGTGRIRVTEAVAEKNKASAGKAWCDFVTSYTKTLRDKYPFAKDRLDDAKPDDVQKWLSTFSVKVFDMALPPSSDKALRDLALRLDVLRRDLGPALDGASIKFVTVTLGNSNPPSSYFGLKWGADEISCKGACLSATAVGRLRMPVSSLAFSMRDATQHILRMPQWSSDYAFLHLLETLGRDHVIKGEASQGAVITARVDLQPTFDDSVHALRELRDDLDELTKAVSCADAP